jgi:hypothetical protein
VIKELFVMKKIQLKNYLSGLLALLLFMSITLYVHCFLSSSNIATKDNSGSRPGNKNVYMYNKLMSQSISIKTHKEDNQIVKAD